MAISMRLNARRRTAVATARRLPRYARNDKVGTDEMLGVLPELVDRHRVPTLSVIARSTAWSAGAGPGDAPFNHTVIAMARARGPGNTARGAAHFLRERRGGNLRADDPRHRRRWMSEPSARVLAIEAIPEQDWTPIPYWMEGAADVAETATLPSRASDAAPVRLIVRRVQPTPGSQLALFATYSYHGFITDREGETLELEADHRRHAEIENAIRDLKYGVGLNHLPSGRFPANGAWLAVQVIAHNLARWTARIGLGEQIVTTKTLRRRFFSGEGSPARRAASLCICPSVGPGKPEWRPR